MSESTELAHRDETGKAIAQTSPLGDVATMLDTMMMLAKDPTVDAAKFETIARVVKETREDAKKQQFYEDKAAAMFEMPSIRKDSKILIPGKGNEPDRVQGTFAKWPDMQRAINPVLDKHNLRLSHDVDHEGTICLVTPILQHRNGYVERGGQMALPLDTSGGKNNTQGAGSAQSYGMRYTTVAMLGIRYEQSDDDGNLIALPDEPLNDQQQRRVKEAETAWASGEEKFQEWFSAMQPQDRAWFVQTGRYADITGRADLPGVQRIASSTPPAGDKPGGVIGKSQPDVSTPEGWTAAYEIQCGDAATLDDLLGIQQAGAKAMARLKDGGFKDLHDRATKAGSDAYTRLSGSDEQQPAGDDLFGKGAE